MDGQVLVSLDVIPYRLNCKGDIEYISKSNHIYIYKFIILNCDQ